MKFQRTKAQILFVDAWRAYADILEMVDMDDYQDMHNENEELIDAIYACYKIMRDQADESEREQELMLEQIQKRYDEKYNIKKGE